ncbi:DUF6090 family protein [Draconibacterium mangrovi]|uniref:DUF6090 family protein n=1 Tax=Draconibacterium mangrovi TaxID=2697469 RepID=UPI0013D8AC35|nr:DUF6090 family protein [Draconibacterium mangrovi]
MLRFFSKMRYKLATKNRAVKYLRYAVGEILLVVIGILIAVQVNNWNEQRKQAKERKALIQSLISDFTATRLRIESIQSEIEQSIQRTSRFLSLSYTNNTNVSVDSLQYYLSGAFVMPPFEPILTSYNQAVSTGKIGLIQNKKFLDDMSKFLITYSWHKHTVDLSGEIFYLGSIWEIRKQIGNLASLAGESRSYNGTRKIVSEAYKLSDEEYRAFIKKPEVFAAIDNMQTIYYNILENSESMDKEAEILIEELEQTK